MQQYQAPAVFPAPKGRFLYFPYIFLAFTALMCFLLASPVSQAASAARCASRWSCMIFFSRGGVLVMERGHDQAVFFQGSLQTAWKPELSSP